MRIKIILLVLVPVYVAFARTDYQVGGTRTAEYTSVRVQLLCGVR